MAEKFLSLSGMQTLWNKVKSVFATKTDVNKKLDVNHVNLNGVTTTILAEVQAMAVNGIHYKRFFTSSDGGSANIPDKPTGTTNAGFVLEAICNRRNTDNDYRYVLLCYVQMQKPKIAWVTQTTTSITWNNLDTTLGTMSVDEGKTGTATTNRGLTAKNLKEIITNYLSQFEGNDKEVTFATVNSSDGELASKRFVAANYEKLLEVGQGLEINDKSDGSCRIIRMKSVDNPTSVLFYHATEGFKLPTQFTFNTLGQFKSSLGSNTLPLPTSFGTSGKILTSNGDGNLPSWEDPPSSLKRVNSYTDEITSTKTGQTFLQLFKELRSNNTTRLNADVDVCLYGSGYSYDFKLLVSIARGGSGTISKCRITIIPLTTNTITIKVRKDSSGLLGIVWENAPSYSGLNVKVSLNTCISSYWNTPSLIFAESGSTFGTELGSGDYSSASSAIKTVAFK